MVSVMPLLASCYGVGHPTIETKTESPNTVGARWASSGRIPRAVQDSEHGGVLFSSNEVRLGLPLAPADCGLIVLQ
jgi:hypothetical protein